MITLEQLVHRRRVLAVSRRRHRPRALPLAPPPRGAIVQHTALLHGISRELDEAIHAELAGMGVVPARTDAADGDAAPRIDPASIAARLRRLVAKILQRKQLVAALDGIAGQVAAFSREQFQRQVRAALGIELPAANPDFFRVFRDFRARNTALITTMAEDKVSRVRRVLHEAGVGTRVEEIAAKLQEQTGITDRHAALVARDQVLKLNGEVTEKRHQEAGVTQYIWRTSEDERVRESHRALDGTKHRYDQPPVVDRKRGRTANPGNDYQCRCTMEPVIEGFDEEFAPGQQYAHGTASPVAWSPKAAAGRGARQAPRAVDEERMRRELTAPRERRAPPDEGSDGPQTVAAREMPGRAIPRPTGERLRTPEPAGLPLPTVASAKPDTLPPPPRRPAPATATAGEEETVARRPGGGGGKQPPKPPPGGPPSSGGDDDRDDRRKPLQRFERLQVYYQRLADLPRPTSADEALAHVRSALDDIEDLHSGIPKADPAPPPSMPDGRMYPPLDDHVTRSPDGSITAKSRAHTIEIAPNGAVRIVNRRTGNVEYERR